MNSSLSLEAIRQKLKNIDKAIVELLNQRASLSIEVGKIKASENLEIYDPSQEKKVYTYLTRINKGILPPRELQHIFREIISASRILQAPLRIAYLGPEASFSHQAARSHFGNSSTFLPQTSIADVFAVTEKEQSNYGIVPIENSLEGSVKATLDRLVVTPLNIRAEIFLRISHALLSAAETIEEVQTVYSHPQAIAQCREWLKKNVPACKLVEVESTAAAAQKVKYDRRSAAIASMLAARNNDLNIIAEGIEDNPSNTTRFLVIGKGKSAPSGHDKTSLIFGTRHVPGSLYRALEPFHQEELNLLRIESYPAREKIWEYLFFVDFDGHREEAQVQKCLKALQAETTFITILGSYPKGEEPC